MPSLHIWLLLNRRATAFMLFKRKKRGNETQKQKQVPRVHADACVCMRVRLFQEPQPTWGAEGKSSVDSGPFKTLRNLVELLRV